MPWSRLLPAALEVIGWLDAESKATDSDYIIASHARTVMDRIAHDLKAAGVATPRGNLTADPSYLPAVLASVDSLLAKLG